MPMNTGGRSAALRGQTDSLAAPSRHRQRGAARRLCLSVLALAVSGFALFPIYWMIVTSLRPLGRTFVSGLELWPQVVSLGAYISVFTERPIALWMWNTGKVATISTALAMVCAVTAAYSLSRFRFRGRRQFGFAVLAVQMVPATVLLMPLYVLFQRYALLDTHLGLVLAHTTFTLPFSVWMLKGFCDTVPVEIEEAALVDGCSRYGVLWRVTLPLMAPGLVVTSLYAFTTSWNEFAFARTLLSRPENWLATPGLASFVGEYVSQDQEMLAAAFVITIPTLVVFAGLQRYLVQGLTSGGLKG
jgi:multiple sugar transport system permease protein